MQEIRLKISSSSYSNQGEYPLKLLFTRTVLERLSHVFELVLVGLCQSYFRSVVNFRCSLAHQTRMYRGKCGNKIEISWKRCQGNFKGNFKKFAFLGLFFASSILLTNVLNPTPALARRGCCSWHGGVCGCDTNVGRQVCCDGTYSPTCTCAYIPQAPVVETKYERKIVVIPFKTERKSNPNLLEGLTQVTQEGKNGKKEITYKVTYTDGTETSRKKVSEEIVKRAISEIISVGTKKPSAGSVAGTSAETNGNGGLLLGALTIAIVGGGVLWFKRRGISPDRAE